MQLEENLAWCPVSLRLQLEAQDYLLWAVMTAWSVCMMKWEVQYDACPPEQHELRCVASFIEVWRPQDFQPQALECMGG